MMHFCCIKATRSHYSVFVQKRRGKHPFLCVHIDLPDNNYGAKDIRFCAFTLLRFLKLIVLYYSVFKCLRFLAFTLIKCVFESLRFCGYLLLIELSKTSVFVAFFVQISVNTFTKTVAFLSVFVKKKTEQCERGRRLQMLSFHGDLMDHLKEFLFSSIKHRLTKYFFHNVQTQLKT